MPATPIVWVSDPGGVLSLSELTPLCLTWDVAGRSCGRLHSTEPCRTPRARQTRLFLRPLPLTLGLTSLSS